MRLGTVRDKDFGGLQMDGTTPDRRAFRKLGPGNLTGEVVPYRRAEVVIVCRRAMKNHWRIGGGRETLFVVLVVCSWGNCGFEAIIPVPMMRLANLDPCAVALCYKSRT